MTRKRKLEEKDNIYMDRDTYRKMLAVYGKASSIPFHSKIIITNDKKEVKKEDVSMG